jgi:sugar phosphate permease
MRRQGTAVIALLFLGYASFYLCRANVSAALPLLQQEGFDKEQLGRLTSIATFTYAIGKLLLGSTGDVLGGRRLMLLAIGGSVVCSLAVGLQHTYALIVFFVAANRFFGSGGWPGLVQVVSQWFEPKRHGAVMGVLSTSYELGNVLVLMLSAEVARHGWRALFVVNPLLFALIGGTAVFALPRPEESPASEPSSTSAPKDATASDASFATFLKELATKGAFWMALVLSILLTFMREGFLTWTPVFLFEVSRAAGNTEVSGAIVKSTIFPLAGVLANLTMGPLSDRFGRGRRAPIMAVSLVVVVGLVLVLAHGGLRDPYAAAGVIGGIGFFLLGPYSLLGGVIALDLSGKRGAATAAGVIDGAGYLLGATSSGWVLGIIANRRGWAAAFDVVAAAAFVAMVVSAAWSVKVMKRAA